MLLNSSFSVFKKNLIQDGRIWYQQIRTIRTKPDLQSLAKKSGQETTNLSNEENGNADIGDINNLQLGDIGKTLGSSNKRRNVGMRSRFQTKEELNDRKVKILNGIPGWKNKSPAEIERDLKTKFDKDGMEYDPLFVQKMIKQSKKEADITEDSLEGGHKVEQVTEEETRSMCKWLINDCKRRLTDQESDIDTEEDMNKILNMQDTDDSIADAIVSVQKLGEAFQPSGLQKLPEFLSVLNRPGNDEVRKMVPLNDLVQLFEISEQLKDDKVRDECVYLSGNLIYMSTPARPDPISERFYIKSLLNHGQFDRAAELFESRRNKPDVINQRFWLDLGIEIYLKMKDDQTVKAESIVEEMREKHGYIHPLTSILFVERYLRLSDVDKAMKSWIDMKEAMDTYGLTDNIEVPDTQIVNDPNVAYDYYNRIDPLTYENIAIVCIKFLKFKRTDEAMSIIETATRRDQKFLIYFVEFITKNVNYPGRECMILTLKADQELEEPKYQPILAEYIIDELEKENPIRCSSLKEALTLDETSYFLSEYLSNFRLSNERKLKVSSLISSISMGSKLTSQECKSLLTVLLSSGSRQGFVITSRIVEELNKSLERQKSGDHTEVGLFPPANSHIYLTLVQLFGRRAKPKITEIESILASMKLHKIPILTVLANQVVLTYRKAHQYTKALEFIDSFLDSDNPDTIPKSTCEFFRNVMKTYRESIANGKDTDPQLKKLRLYRLRLLFKDILSREDWEMDQTLCIEAMITFLNFGDIPSTICVLEYYGMVMKKPINNDLMLAIKLRLEASIVKMESYLNTQELENIKPTIDNFREECGLLSLKTDLQADKDYNWRDAAGILIKYMDVLDYEPKVSSFSTNSISSVTSEKRQQNKDSFERELNELQNSYEIPEVGISEII